MLANAFNSVCKTYYTRRNFNVKSYWNSPTHRIPVELRRTMDIKEKDPLEIFVDGNKIILQKYEPACIFCGNAEDVTNYKGKMVCRECLSEMRKG